MMRLSMAIGLWFVLMLVARANGLPPGVVAALDQAAIPQDAAAILVLPANGGTPAVEMNAALPMNPASVMKLVTSYAALEKLGPAYTWKTRIWAGGEIRDGKLMGDLIVRGGGDPFLTIERLWLLQRALRQKGVREIQGNLVLDLSLYDLSMQDAGAFDGEPLAAYNAVPSPLVVNFNAQTVRFGVEGDAVQIRSEIPLRDIRFVSRLLLIDAPCNGWRSQIKARIAESGVDQHGREVVFEGSYPRSCGEKSMALNLFEASLNFAQVFRALWEESGGKWSGNVQPGLAPVEAKPLLEFESLPLADILRPLNKHSSNIMTRMLYLTLGQEYFGGAATLEKSALAVREILAARALALLELVLENGAGLSRLERISAQGMAQLLKAAQAGRNFSEFESSLPVAATDGTMKSRLNGNGSAGHAHLKTGTLRDAKALAGYVLDRAGRRWVVVFFINHPNAEQGAAAQDALIEWVYRGAVL